MSAIQPFYGELFIMPLPLEVSHNYCSHKCGYCFANLDSAYRVQQGTSATLRTVDSKKLFSQIINHADRKGYAEYLMQQKKVICVSNKTDPFATSNYKIAVPMLEMLTGYDIPVCIQTRGGKGLDSALKFLKPTIFYVSICQTDDNIRSIKEPGGTSLQKRWEMIDELHAYGHKVVVAINPYYSTWIDTDLMVKNLVKHNITHVIVQGLHLNYKQERAMSAKEQKAFAEEIPVAKKLKIDPIQDAAIHEFIGAVQQTGIKVYEPGRVNNDNFMGIYHEAFPTGTFKTYYDFAQWCYANKQDNDEVYFREFWEYMKDSLPTGKMRIYNYLTSINEKFRNKTEFALPSEMSFKDIAKIMWNDLQIKRHPAGMETFALLVERTGTEEDDIMYKDKFGHNIYVWNTLGHECWSTDFSNQL